MAICPKQVNYIFYVKCDSKVKVRRECVNIFVKPVLKNLVIPSRVRNGCRAHLGGFVSHAGYTGGVGGITGPVA